MISRLRRCAKPALAIAATAIGLSLTLLVGGCGNCGDSKTFIPHPCGPRQANEPIFYEREAEGVYPRSVASLNGQPTYFIGLRHHFTRAR